MEQTGQVFDGLICVVQIAFEFRYDKQVNDFLRSPLFYFAGYLIKVIGRDAKPVRIISYISFTWKFLASSDMNLPNSTLD